MEFSAEHDVDAPQAAVFAAISDFDRLTHEARAHDVEAVRSDARDTPGIGCAWRIEYTMRGARRRALAQVTAWQPPEGYAIATQTNLIALDTTITVRPLTPDTARLRVVVAVSARTLSGRILLQSARLGRARLDDRLARGLARLAARIGAEDRAARPR
jgi:hypothetical protein